MEEPMRTTDQVREHYLLEKELAARIRFANARERKKLYNEVYDELFRKITHHPTLRKNKIPDEQRQRIKNKMDQITPFLNSDSVFLEAGPGDCSLCIEISKIAAKVYAIDVTKEAVGKTSFPENLQMEISDGTSIPVSENSIDVAFSDQLMEHLHPDDAAEQLSNLFKALRPGGKYICITPNRLNGPHDISSHFDYVATGFHLKEYTTAEINNLFKQAGFSKVQPYIRYRKKIYFLPSFLVIALEKIISMTPRRIRRSLAGTRAIRSILGIKVVATK